ncbi:MAG: hypothetical protein V2A77_08305 [Pseudomonadota bacterium]
MGINLEKHLFAAAMAAALTLCAPARAAMFPPDVNVVNGTVSSYSAETGEIVVAGHTLYLTAQTQLHKRVGDHFEDAGSWRVSKGDNVRAMVNQQGGHYEVRTLDLLDPKRDLNPLK